MNRGSGAVVSIASRWTKFAEILAQPGSVARTLLFGWAICGLAALTAEVLPSHFAPLTLLAAQEPAAATDPNTQDPTPQEPSTEAPTTDDPSTESPSAESPTGDQSTGEQSTTDEPMSDEPGTVTEDPELLNYDLPHPFDQVTNSPPRYDLTPYTPSQEQQARSEFESISKRIREIYRELLQAKTDFEFATDRTMLTDSQTRWAELRIEGEALFVQMQDLAARLFVTDPNREGIMYRMVLDAILEDAEQGRMWTCYRNIVLLRRTVGLDKAIDSRAAVAAFRCCQFEEFANFMAFVDPTQLDDKHREIVPIFERVSALWNRELPVRIAEAKADDLPRVRMVTTKGEVILELFENEAPNTVANFITLCEQGYYEGLPFHRVIAGFVAQAGETLDPELPGYRIRCECHRPDGRAHFIGSIAMAHAGRDTGAAQFYISYGPQPNLDGLHTVFGRVISGMEFAERINRIDPENLKGNEIADRIIRMEVIRKRPHDYVVEKIEAR